MRTRLYAEDNHFSFCVRARAWGRCEGCGVQIWDVGNKGAGLDCSHFYGRADKGLRWHPWNAAAHCVSCHSFLGQNPVLFAKWIRYALPAKYVERIAVLHRQTFPTNKSLRREIAAHYLSEKRRLEALLLELEPFSQPLTFISFYDMNLYPWPQIKPWPPLIERRKHQ